MAAVISITRHGAIFPYNTQEQILERSQAEQVEGKLQHRPPPRHRTMHKRGLLTLPPLFRVPSASQMRGVESQAQRAHPPRTLDFQMSYGLMRVLVTHPRTPPCMPPVLLIGGTAQCCTSWGGIAPAIAATGRVVVSFDARGQGSTHVCQAHRFDMAAHVGDLRAMIAALFDSELPAQPLDVAGFSFGGRLALALAAECPSLVRRLVVTGVPARRDQAAADIFDRWRQLLLEGRLRDMISLQIASCHSPKFLSKFTPKQLQLLTSATVAQNSAAALLGLLRDSHVSDETSAYHTVNLAHCVSAGRVPVLLIGGTLDAVAPQKEVERLAADNGWDVRMFEAGHNVPAELPVQWRQCVLEHFS